MKMKIVKAIALILAMICILCFPIPASAISQGTDGTELQVMKPQNLQIHLGEAWAGVEFELTTDAGKYPGTIPVGEDGVLRLEIGGSENYILSCVDASASIPVPGENKLPEETAGPAAETTDPAEPTPSETLPEVSGLGSVAGIPLVQLLFYAGGLAAAVATLAAIHFSQKRSGKKRDPEDFDDDI